MFIVFDLDGTLCDITHRLHLIDGKGVKHWPSFYKSCVNDAPIQKMHELFRELAWHNHIEIWSGRSDIALGETVDWLSRFNLSSAKLRLREDGDHRDDVDVKEAWLADARPDIVFEDRQRVVDMWRRHGIMCCQVAPGAF